LIVRLTYLTNAIRLLPVNDMDGQQYLLCPLKCDHCMFFELEHCVMWCWKKHSIHYI